MAFPWLCGQYLRAGCASVFTKHVSWVATALDCICICICNVFTKHFGWVATALDCICNVFPKHFGWVALRSRAEVYGRRRHNI